MEFKAITSSDKMWRKTRDYAWDCIPDLEYVPYIGYVFVDEAYRGNRLSQRMLNYAMEYLKGVGFEKVYLVSDHENFYEKYGFTVIGKVMAPWGAEEKIYEHKV